MTGMDISEAVFSTNKVHFPHCHCTFFFKLYFVQLYSPSGISPMENSGCFPWGKPAATVALPNLLCMLGVIVFPHSTELLTWTTEFLTCAQMLMQAIAPRGVYGHTSGSLHWKLTVGEKSLAALGNRTCVSGVMVRCSNQLSYIPTPDWKWKH